jgi:cytochrome P450
MTATEISYDPYDYAVDAHPHPVWRRMRDEQPCYYNERYDFYALTRFEDVRNASREWQTFSSASGTVLELMRDPKTVDRLRNILFEDPPIHDLHRSIMSRAFTPRRVSGLEPRVRELCRQYLDEIGDADRFDFVQDYGAKLPMMVIGALLGFPDSEQVYFRDLADRSMHRDEEHPRGDPSVIVEMMAFINEFVAQRRAQPADDVMSDLIAATFTDDEGVERGLNDRELVNYIWLLGSAGNETVARLLGWAGYTLAQHPDQRQLLVDDPALIPNGIEELLRYEAPSPVNGRVVMHDVELHGTALSEGALVLLLTGAAGRDEREFPEPDVFDVRRKIDHQMSFGYGIHFCLGAALARLEGRVGLEELLARHPTWELDLDRAEMVHTSTVRGWHHLPVGV